MRLPPAAEPVSELDPLVARRIALEIRCDPRTVLRESRQPGAVRGVVGILIRRALADLRAARSSGGHAQPAARAHRGAR